MTKKESTPIAVGILGLGKMGEALVKGIRRSADAKKFKLVASSRSKQTALDVSKRLEIECLTDNLKLVKSSQVIVLCVKPQQARSVLEEISGQLTSKHLIISACASLTTHQLSEWSGGRAAIVRSMPNTPSLIGEGMTVFCSGPRATAEHMDVTSRIFSTVGQALSLEEDLMDGVTGLSGCGPAYIYLVIEALSEAGVKVGLPRKVATHLAAQTLVGAAKMVLDRGEHPAALKDEVTTPGGCTVDGLMALEEGRLRVTLIKAVLAAAKRSSMLRAASS